MIITRHGEVFDEINPLTTGAAPDFQLTDLANHKVKLSELADPIIISIFPDINTSVCALQSLFYQFQIIHLKNKQHGVQQKVLT